MRADRPARTPTTPAILRTAQLLDMLGVSRMTLHRWRRDQQFPAAVQLGPRAIGWLRSDVEAWLANRPTA